VTPAFKIIAEGENITAMIADRLLDLKITDKAGVESDEVSITIDDRAQLVEFPKVDAEIEVSLGYVGQALVTMGIYIVDEVEVSGPPRSMTIRAKAADMNKGLKSPKERSFVDIEFGDLVKTIAGEHGLEPAISEDLAKRFLGHIDQTESDLQLLTRICAEQSAIMKIADKRLVVALHASEKAASGTDLPAGVIDAGQCDSWSAVVAHRTNYKSVKAYWHDLKKAERTPVTAGSGTPVLTLKHSYIDEEAAMNAATSKLKSSKRGIGKVSIKGVIGDPYLSAEQPVEMVNFRIGVDGPDWVINEVTHTLSSGGYTCDLELEAKE
jgi:phage protein D